MDILSHGLWAALGAKAYNAQQKPAERHTRLSYWKAAFWGMFPDLFAFVLPMIVLGIASLFTGDQIPAMRIESFEGHSPFGAGYPGREASLFTFVPAVLYHLSHSFIVFFVIFAIVSFIARRPLWILGGWPLHILFDIPTHSTQFYPTPFLWPLFDFKVDGMSWAKPWFIAVNYGLLLIVFLVLRAHQKKKALRTLT